MASITISPDKAFYDAEPIGEGANHRKYVRKISSYFSTYADRLNADLQGTPGVVLELGAGSCAVSCNAVRLPNVTKAIAADISPIRMDRSISKTSAILNADRDKISTMGADFNEPLDGLEDESVDAILFDAALHHARNIWNLLAECRRILRPGGKLIAQRESYLSPFRAKKQLALLLKEPEVLALVSENRYLKTQYEYYLQVYGFEPEFLPHPTTRLKRLLSFANGTLFVDGTLYCTKA